MILLIYNAELNNMTCNSVLKLFRNLNKYRSDIIIYTINYTNNTTIISKYLNDIKEIIQKNKIDLIFCVWTYFDEQGKNNIVTNLVEQNLSVKILCHLHDTFSNGPIYFPILRDKCYFFEIGLEYHIKNFINSDKLFSIIHCATDNFLLKFNDNPINKILLSGAVFPPLYSTRLQVKNLCLKNNIKFDIKNHPGFFKIENQYPNLLNSYIACFYTSIDVNIKDNDKNNDRIILAKAFEIPATGSLLVAHDSCKKGLEKVGFIENENCIFFNFENFNKVTDYILDLNNRHIIDNIRKKGQELILNNHCESLRIKQINSILDSLIL
jgi:hypothetical protein